MAGSPVWNKNKVRSYWKRGWRLSDPHNTALPCDGDSALERWTKRTVPTVKGVMPTNWRYPAIDNEAAALWGNYAASWDVSSGPNPCGREIDVRSATPPTPLPPRIISLIQNVSKIRTPLHYYTLPALPAERSCSAHPRVLRTYLFGAHPRLSSKQDLLQF